MRPVNKNVNRTIKSIPKREKISYKNIQEITREYLTRTNCDKIVSLTRLQQNKKSIKKNGQKIADIFEKQFVKIVRF